MEVKKKCKTHHGVADKSPLQIQICGTVSVTLVVRKAGLILIVLVGLTAGWLAGRQSTGKFQVFEMEIIHFDRL